MRIWTKAFWKDAAERVGSTFFQVFGGALIAVGINFKNLDDWSFWEPVLWATVLVLVKVMGAGFWNPNTGASLGTTNPADIVKAIETQTDVVDPETEATVSMAGETVAGKAAVQDTNTPVEVVSPGPSPYTPDAARPQ